jgi:heptosyltransferase-3
MVADAIPLASVRRALVIKLRHHGDVLLASPVLSVLKAHLPQAEIDALVYAETAPMLSEHPSLSELHTIDRAWKKHGAGAHAAFERQLLGRLRARGYDLVVHLTDAARGAWLARLLGPSFSVAPRRDDDPSSATSTPCAGSDCSRRNKTAGWCSFPAPGRASASPACWRNTD